MYSCLFFTRVGLFLCLLSLCPLVLPVHATTYQWEDEQGNINFSDDLTRVPPSSREKVVEVPLPVSSGRTSTDKDAPAADAQEASDASPGVQDGVGSSGQDVDPYGDCMEKLDEKTQQLEKQLAADRARLEDLITGIRRTTITRKKRPVSANTVNGY